VEEPLAIVAGSGPYQCQVLARQKGIQRRCAYQLLGTLVEREWCESDSLAKGDSPLYRTYDTYKEVSSPGAST
jgi:hypothetical protein